MPGINLFREIALGFPESEALPHFEKTSFRVAKKIFATLDEKAQTGVLLLTPEDQDIFSLYDPAAIYPLPNKWGLKGATVVHLNKVREDMLKDAFVAAYCKAAPKKLSDRIMKSRNENEKDL